MILIDDAKVTYYDLSRKFQITENTYELNEFSINNGATDLFDSILETFYKQL